MTGENVFDDGGPAFPQFEEAEFFDDDLGKYKTKILPTGGMSLRDWFAGQALNGYMSHFGFVRSTSTDLALTSYAIANAMLEARKRPADSQGEK